MKHNNRMMTVILLSTAAFAVGCNKEESTSQQVDKIEAKTEAAAQDMKDYTYAQKAEYTAKMRTQLAAINKDLDQLAVKVNSGSDEVKAEAKPKLDTLREQTVRLNKQLDDAQDATESTWDGVKAGSRKAYDDLKDGFNQARQWVSNKIAP